jgi:hypothetical protein
MTSIFSDIKRTIRPILRQVKVEYILSGLHWEQVFEFFLINLERSFPLVFNFQETAVLCVEDLGLLLQSRFSLFFEHVSLLQDSLQLLVLSHFMLY